ncbi:hypothetical protein [Methanolobus bombayensis]|uniref:hypothetical protein n=1 Tax=Methanolobus bombayensis TaxID=38023 RepID=UPI001AEAFC4E|nr:hypothetical protein [Methanolobus bombayensis]MBP1909730.1 hypothetical protein [Methanolobus bombayensis]
MPDIKDSLKLFIDSRMEEAIRSQAIYPDRLYVKSALIRNITPEHKSYGSGLFSCDSDIRNGFERVDIGINQSSKEFKW